jgi:hypothetical protein
VPRKAKKKAVVVQGRRLKVSLYERTSSGLLAMLITIGSVVSLLLIIWLSNKIFIPQLAVPVDLVEVAEDGEGGGDGRPTGGSQLDTPSDEPVVGRDKETADVQEEMSVMDNNLVAKAAELDDPDLATPTRHGSYGSGGGIYGGFGDGRGLGHGPGKPGLPRHWEVMFAKNTLEAYARQLDFFKIELGVLMPDNKIIYVINLTKQKPDTRTVSNPALNEKRYYLTWRTGEMQQADKELLAKAGVDSGDHLILKFLPTEVERDLLTKERSFRGVDPKKMGKTRFGVRAVGDGYEFYVLDQTQKR